MYKKLGVPKNATPEQIRSAYLKLAHKYHPDRNSGTVGIFQEIQIAYETLSDPRQRLLYDNTNIVEKDVKLESIYLAVSAKDLYVGGKKTVEFTKNTQCNNCGGSGAIKSIKCLACSGRKYRQKLMQRGSNMVPVHAPCTKCNASGINILEGCDICSQTGQIGQLCSIVVNLAPKTLMQTFTFENQINVITKLKDKNIQILNNNIIIEKTIGLWDSINGIEFEYEHLDGQILTIACPNIIKDSSSLKLLGFGFGDADLIFNFNITYPDSVPADIKEALKQHVFYNSISDKPKYFLI